jgi:hypothetical protein
MQDRNRDDVRDTGRHSGSRNWEDEERFWRDNYTSRPYAAQDRQFDEFRPGYRYGFESAQRHTGRDWNEAEPELRAGWDRYEHRGDNRSTWDQIKDSVRDAWDRVSGSDSGSDSGRDRHRDR